MKRNRTAVVFVMMTMAATLGVLAQTPPPPRPAAGGGAQGGRGAGGGPRTDYPSRPPADPAVLERGRALYGVHCAFCHGSEARGGDGGGPSLLRSELVLEDQHGELVAPVVQNGRPDRGMDPIKLTDAQVADVAAFIHSFRVGGYDISRRPPPSILVGTAAAGEAVFRAKCSACHSVTGDLKGFGAKFADPKQLQQTWLMPGAGGRGGRGQGPSLNVPPTTVTVTMPSGEKTEGRLVRIDDFVVTLTQADGTRRSFRRDSDVPSVQVHDPLQPHRELLPSYTDKDIHDLTAYLVTVK